MSVTSSLVSLLLDAVTLSGSAPEPLLGEAGLSWEALFRRERGASEAEYERFYESALDVTGDAALGLHLAERAAERDFGIVSQLAASSRTLRDCIEVSLAYFQLCADGRRPELHVEAGRAVFGFPQPSRSRGARLRTEFAMLSFVRLAKQLLGHQLESLELWFAYPRPTHGDEYTRLFGTKVSFDMPRTGILFSAALLDAEQPRWDPALHELLHGEAQRALHRLGAREVSERTRGVLSGLRLGQRPEMGEAARVLGMSERSLRRRLAAEGVCFRELVDDVQRERALVLARDPRRSAEATSDALGFSEVSAFHRAFKRWTGLTPMQYRMGARPGEELITRAAS